VLLVLLTEYKMGLKLEKHHTHHIMRYERGNGFMKYIPQLVLQLLRELS
jgi:hypothetical protein